MSLRSQRNFLDIFCLPLLFLSAVDASADQPVPVPIEPAAVQHGRAIDYLKDVAPVLEANCVACHNSFIDEGRLSLEDREGMLRGGKHGPAIVPGKPDESRLLLLATHRQQPVMPPLDNGVEAANLTPGDLGLLRQWIAEGAQFEAPVKPASLAWQPIPQRVVAVQAVSLSPDGRFVAVGRGNRLDVHAVSGATFHQRLADPALVAPEPTPAASELDGIAHRDLIQAIAFSPEGSRIATAGYREVKLWRNVGFGAVRSADAVLHASNESRPAALTTAADDGTNATLIATVSPDGRWSATLNASFDVTVVDRTTNAVAFRYPARRDSEAYHLSQQQRQEWLGAVRQAAHRRVEAAREELVEREQMLVQAEAEIRAAKQVSNDEAFHLSELVQRNLQYARDAYAKQLAAVEAAEAESAQATQGYLKTFDSSGQPRRWIAEEPTGFCFLDDGRLLSVFRSGMVIVNAVDGTASAWIKLPDEIDTLIAANAREAKVITVRGETLAVGLQDRWELETVLGPPKDDPSDLSRSAFANRVRTLAFSPDGERLATGGGNPSRSAELYLWDLKSAGIATDLSKHHSDTVQALAFSRDGRWLATASTDKFAKLFDLQAMQPIATLEGHIDHVLGVAIRPDADEVATAGADMVLKLWDTRTGQQRRTIAAHNRQATAIAYVGLSDSIASAGGDGSIAIHRGNDGVEMHRFREARGFLQCLSATSDGRLIATGDEQGTAVVWDVATGRAIRWFGVPRTALVAPRP